MSVLPPPFAPLSPLHCVDEDDHDSSDADIDIDGQELVNEPKGIHEPFEDMDCFQVSFSLLTLFVPAIVIDIVFVFVFVFVFWEHGLLLSEFAWHLFPLKTFSNIYISSRSPKIARVYRIQIERLVWIKSW